MTGEKIDDEDDSLDDDEDNDTYCSPLPCEEREGWDDERDAPCIGDLCCCPHVDHSRDECFTAEDALREADYAALDEAGRSILAAAQVAAETSHATVFNVLHQAMVHAIEPHVTAGRIDGDHPEIEAVTLATATLSARLSVLGDHGERRARVDTGATRNEGEQTRTLRGELDAWRAWAATVLGYAVDDGTAREGIVACIRDHQRLGTLWAERLRAMGPVLAAARALAGRRRSEAGDRPGGMAAHGDLARALDALDAVDPVAARGNVAPGDDT